MWDDFYGKQPNPYTADDFRAILAALIEVGANEDLIERTREALATEEA